MADEKQLAILKTGVENWNRWRKENIDETIDLAGADLSYTMLEGANLLSANLREANLSHARLKGAVLSHADLTRANIAFAHLENATMLYTRFVESDLRGANMKGALLEDADLTRANLVHANCERVMMSYATLKDANLLDVNLTGAHMIAVNLEGAKVVSVVYDKKVSWDILKKTGFNPFAIWKRRKDLVLNTTIRCRGIHTACHGSQQFRHFLEYQDYLEEVMETKSGERVCFIWWLFADCGRSLLRWASWSLFFTIFFACIYTLLGTAHFRIAFLPFNFLTLFYFSIVTFTTLGYGDVVPRSEVAAYIVTSEVIIGYIMLGGIISIFAGKLLRR